METGFSGKEWRQTLGLGNRTQVSERRLHFSVVSGFPANLRGEIWSYLSASNALAKCFSSQVYARLLNSIDPDTDSTISRDVYRTFPTVDMFEEKDGYGQKGLMNVLKAYAAYDPEVGYCQGMGFLAGMLLMEMYTEEAAFWQLVQILQSYNWRAMFQ